MKVKELIAELQKCDPEAEAYRCWYETNESGTTWDTGEAVSRVSNVPAHASQYGRKREPQVELW